MLKVVHQHKTNSPLQKLCPYCMSEDIQFIEFDRVQGRKDDKKILVHEIWVCSTCEREFELIGTLYSPIHENTIKVRTAVLTWLGYTAGSLLVYLFIA